MDIGSTITGGTLIAAIVAAVSNFVVGGLWYSPLLFARPWMAYNGFTEEQLRSGGSMGKIFGLTFFAGLVAAFNLAMFVGPSASAGRGAMLGFLVGFGWVAMAFASSYLFERKTLGHWLINAGYFVVSYTLMGVLVAVTRGLLG